MANPCLVCRTNCRLDCWSRSHQAIPWLNSRTKRRLALPAGLPLATKVVRLDRQIMHASTDEVTLIFLSGGLGGIFLTYRIARLQCEYHFNRAASLLAYNSGEPAMLTAIGSAARVLVVDDTVDVATSFGYVLTLYGFRVHIASNGARALASLADFKPEAILLDIGLPDMTGYEVAMRVRSEDAFRNIPIVAISGTDRDRLKSEQAGIIHYLEKPIDIEQLKALLGELLGSDANNSVAV